MHGDVEVDYNRRQTLEGLVWVSQEQKNGCSLKGGLRYSLHIKGGRYES